jgi:outer membrane protein
MAALPLVLSLLTLLCADSAVFAQDLEPRVDVQAGHEAGDEAGHEPSKKVSEPQPQPLSIPSISEVFATQAAEIGDGEDFRYLIGAAIKYGPDYWGSTSLGTSFSPVWALRWGKWRLSSSGGAALMGFGQQAIGPGAGASRELFKSDVLRLGIGLRRDGGRSASDEGPTAGLPKVSRTVRGRIYAAYLLAPGWNLSGALSQDLAGKDGGLVANLDLSRVLYKAPSAELLAGLGVAGGNARYMRSYFGVSNDIANQPGSAWQGRTYEPGAGLREAHFNLGYTHAFSAHWVGFASAGISQMLGPAAASPITQQHFGQSVGFSLAYRN